MFDKHLASARPAHRAMSPPGVVFRDLPPARVFPCYARQMAGVSVGVSPDTPTGHPVHPRFATEG